MPRYGCAVRDTTPVPLHCTSRTIVSPSLRILPTSVLMSLISFVVALFDCTNHPLIVLNHGLFFLPDVMMNIVNLRSLSRRADQMEEG